MNNNRNTFLPLWAWATVVLIIFTILLMAYFNVMVKIDSNFDNAENLNLARLNNLEGKKPIIVIGSSLTYRAMYFDNQIQPLLAKRGIENKFVRITMNGARKYSFEKDLAAIAVSYPQLVFIELRMLLVNPSSIRGEEKQRIWLNLQIAYDLVKRVILNTFDASQNIWKNYGDTEHCKYAIEPQEKYPTLEELPQQQYSVYPSFLSPAWKEFIAQINNNGGQVIMLELARSDYASQGLTPQFKADYQANINKITASQSLGLWRFPGPFDSENYCDLAHLNKQGKENFMNWFIDRLDESFND